MIPYLILAALPLLAALAVWRIRVQAARTRRARYAALPPGWVHTGDVPADLERFAVLAQRLGLDRGTCRWVDGPLYTPEGQRVWGYVESLEHGRIVCVTLPVADSAAPHEAWHVAYYLRTGRRGEQWAHTAQAKREIAELREAVRAGRA